MRSGRPPPFCPHPSRFPWHLFPGALPALRCPHFKTERNATRELKRRNGSTHLLARKPGGGESPRDGDPPLPCGSGAGAGGGAGGWGRCLLQDSTAAATRGQMRDWGREHERMGPSALQVRQWTG